MQPIIPVFYRPEMSAPPTDSFAPGAHKPKLVVDDWLQDGTLPITLRSFEPATHEQVCLAHDPAYVQGVLACEIPNGFSNCDPDVAAALPYTSGAMLAAAKEAIDTSGVACAPVSGFHHAHYAAPRGYCTFNGLMITALVLQQSGLAHRIGILDLDQHYGDGTAEIIQRTRAERIVHYTAGDTYREASEAEAFLRELPAIVRRFEHCAVLLYQAGADPHVRDPLGGWMSTEQLAQRDRIVFEEARAMGVPIAWDLAGGYQRDKAGTLAPVLAIHRNTMRECVRVYAAT